MPLCTSLIALPAVSFIHPTNHSSFKATLKCHLSFEAVFASAQAELTQFASIALRACLYHNTYYPQSEYVYLSEKYFIPPSLLLEWELLSKKNLIFFISVFPKCGTQYMYIVSTHFHNWMKDLSECNVL